jgi:hypothetical protein
MPNEEFMDGKSWKSFLPLLELESDRLFPTPSPQSSPFLLSAQLVTEKFGKDDSSTPAPKFKGTGTKSFEVYAGEWTQRFLHSEKKFVEELQMLENHFNNYILNHFIEFGMESQSLAKQLVVPVQDVIRVLQNMIHAMQIHTDHRKMVGLFIESCHYLTMEFNKYLDQLSISSTSLTTCMTKKVFVSALERLNQSSPGSKFSSARGKVSSHVTIYPIMLQELVEACPVDHPSYDTIFCAHRAAKDVTVSNNASGAEVDSQKMMIQLASRLIGSTLISKSTFITDLKVDQLVVKQNKKKIAEERVPKVLLLLNTCFVLVSLEGERKGVAEYRFDAQFPIGETRVVQVGVNQFVISFKDMIYEFSKHGSETMDRFKTWIKYSQYQITRENVLLVDRVPLKSIFADRFTPDHDFFYRIVPSDYTKVDRGDVAIFVFDGVTVGSSMRQKWIEAAKRYNLAVFIEVDTETEKFKRTFKSAVPGLQGSKYVLRDAEDLEQDRHTLKSDLLLAMKRVALMKSSHYTFYTPYNLSQLDIFCKLIYERDALIAQSYSKHSRVRTTVTTSSTSRFTVASSMISGERGILKRVGSIASKARGYFRKANVAPSEVSNRVDYALDRPPRLQKFGKGGLIKLMGLGKQSTRSLEELTLQFDQKMNMIFEGVMKPCKGAKSQETLLSGIFLFYLIFSFACR